ncbi:hypothetical protein CENSYa_0579 [Cenarchaeum symbiosum A]|uniref:Holliday junction resolvase n=1 Tax=Cenarchaeum symbiosum (strain A) TaxID=414004 RepID=A0RV45_CENSY|nr:hypothetical protein CENSYa_0579 [Cenarchaeum symbiosum A]
MRAKRSAAYHRKVSRTRRQRGYAWEDAIVKRFNGAEGWRAFRLGSPSTGLPDVLAVGPAGLYAIEAKSGTATSLTVPADQIERCLSWTRAFGAYHDRRAVLAFKFLSKKRTGTGTYESRRLREYFVVWDGSPVDCICTYDGETYARRDGERSRIRLARCSLPFATRTPDGPPVKGARG